MHSYTYEEKEWIAKEYEYPTDEEMKEMYDILKIQYKDINLPF